LPFDVLHSHPFRHDSVLHAFLRMLSLPIPNREEETEAKYYANGEGAHHCTAANCDISFQFCMSACACHTLFPSGRKTEAKYYADGEDAYEMRKYFTEAAAAKSKRRRGSKSGADKQRRASSAAGAAAAGEDNSTSSSSTTEKAPAAVSS
jgi:hypothetical protein